MKRLLAVILSLAVVMSLLCVVPAQARVIQGAHYYIEDFEKLHSNNVFDENGVVIDPATTDAAFAVNRVSGAGYGGSDYALKVEARAAANSKNIAGSTNKIAFDGEIGKVAPGEKLVISMKYKSLSDLGGDTTAAYMGSATAPAFCVFMNGYYTADEKTAGASDWNCVSIDATGSDEWKTVTFEYDYRTNATNMTYMYLYLGQYGANMKVTENGATATFYFDDIEIRKEKNPELADAVTPAVSDLTATMAMDGKITASYTYTEDGAAVETHQSFWRVVTADGGVLTCESSHLNGAHIPAAYKSSDLYYEVVPVSANGDIGETVRVPLGKPAKQSIWLGDRAADGIVVVSGTQDIENYNLIFVTYDDNNKMVDSEIVPVNQYYGETKYYKPVDLAVGTKTKAMLWGDMTSCKPKYVPFTELDASNWVDAAE